MYVDLADTSLTSRYRLVERIGSGGMGVVYRALDRLTQQEVALKRVFLSPQTWNSTSEIGSDPPGSLAREFQILASLRHPNIISVLDYGFDHEGMPYLTMDLLSNALDIVEQSRKNIYEQNLQLLTQMLLALSYLHRRGIVHRDLKPSNVLVSSDETVKLLDFGLAQKERQTEGTTGTLSYMAPEVLQNKQSSSASDLFSAGVIAYEIFGGLHPFADQSPSKTIRQILHETPDAAPLAHLPRELQNFIFSLLAKDPEDRFPSAMDSIHALYAGLERPVPPETTAYQQDVIYTPAFAGRTEALQQLKEAVQQLPDGGSTWLISGVSGAGKSRLLDELRIYAVARGIPVLVGSGEEASHVIDEIWRDVLPSLVLEVALEDGEASELKPIIPQIEQLLGRDIPDAPEWGYQEERKRLTQIILTLFQRVQRPLLLFMDDLQWVPEGELFPLQQLHRLTPELPLLIVGTYRSDEAPYLYGKFPLAQQIDLQGLDEREVEQIVRKTMGNRPDLPEIVDFLATQTAGNALFLVEVLRIMAEDAGGIEQIQTAQMPVELASQGVIRVLKQRLQHVRLDDQPMLRLAALLGKELDFELLRVHDDEVDIEEWLLRAANAAILTVQGGIWRFTHDKVREAVLDGLDEQYVRKLHGLAAKALEAVYGDDPAYLDAIVQHWRSADRMDREVGYLPRLVNRLVDQGHYDEALELSERGLTYANDTGDVSATSVANLHLNAGHASINHGAFDQAQGHLEAAYNIAIAEENSMLTGQAFAGSGKLAMSRGDFAAAESAYDQAIAIFRDTQEPMALAAVLTNRAVLAAQSGDIVTAKQFFEELLTIHENDQRRPYGLAAALTNLGNVAHIQGERKTALNYLGRALAIAKEHDLNTVAAGILNNLGVIEAEIGDYAEAEQYLREAEQIVEELGAYNRLVVSHYYQGMIALLRGELDRAEDFAQSAHERSSSAGGRYEMLQSFCLYTYVTAAAGKVEQARDLLAEALSLAQQMDHPSLYPIPLYGAIALAIQLEAFELAAEWVAYLVRELEETELRSRHLIMRVKPDLIEQMGEAAYHEAEIRSKYLDPAALVRTLHKQLAPTQT